MNIEKVPCLAIVVYDTDPVNIGLIVKVVGPARWLATDDWMVVSEGRPLKCVDVDTGDFFFDQDGDLPDAWLRPVSGLPVDEEITDEVTA